MESKHNHSSDFVCPPEGLLLPIFDESGWKTGTRTILYFLGLMYSFIGIALVSNVFISSIERIAFATKKVPIKDRAHSSAMQYIEKPIWNPTVANLTVMALGTSAPEILLSVIEMIGK
ncbi:unnamed protein product [Soboliphyme baturini]|uniref:Na_Ca_ex domain-containing protein n=1 Tax=Soboliphyme baturini TaxID=241478 RepID=A0A183IER3_9BILA|nr:unnamed protein product [Soboliphyme baturini]